MSGANSSIAMQMQVDEDSLWKSVREGAKKIADAEPLLVDFVTTSVLERDNLAEALAFILANRLRHAGVSAELSRKAFCEALKLDSNIAAAMRIDLAATVERDPASHRAIEPVLYFKGYHALQTHRFAHAMYLSGRKDFALYLQSRSSQVYQVDMHPAVKVGCGVMLDHGTGIVIGETATIGDHVSILQGVTLGGTGKEEGDRHPKVGNGVLIGAGAKILGNIKIGHGSLIAAGSVVLKDVPSHTTVAGVPAKIIGKTSCSEPGCVMDQLVAPLE